MSRCAPTTRCGSAGSNPGGVATTLAERPAGTLTPHDSPAGTSTRWRATSYPSRVSSPATQPAARSYAGLVASRGPILPARWRTARTAVAGSRSSAASGSSAAGDGPAVGVPPAPSVSSVVVVGVTGRPALGHGAQVVQASRRCVPQRGGRPVDQAGVDLGDQRAPVEQGAVAPSPRRSPPSTSRPRRPDRQVSSGGGTASSRCRGVRPADRPSSDDVRRTAPPTRSERRAGRAVEVTRPAVASPGPTVRRAVHAAGSARDRSGATRGGHAVTEPGVPGNGEQRRPGGRRCS